ncbi:MAG: AraC family transcriptional regulator [Chitinophagaceae bacterium]
MKAVLRQITATPDHSFLIRKDCGESMINDWHYHPEIEFLYIKKSAGTWLIGDHISHFQSGDVILIGPDLPHCFRHEKEYVNKRSKRQGETICIKFLPGIFGDTFFEMPETRAIKSLLSKSNKGLRLTGKPKATIAKMMDKIAEATPGRRLLVLLSMLEEIAETKEYNELSSKGFMQTSADPDKERIKTIFDYTFNHYNEKITIDQLASLMNMTRESFCRYFKSKTKKTYIQFLMEVRIGYACRLLVEDEKNVTEISYECGYNNISHFNHQFKIITKKTPLAYKKDFLLTERFTN